MSFVNKLNKIKQKFFPKKFGVFFKKLKKDKKFYIDPDLNYLLENFIDSKSYKFVSNQWHLINIKDLDAILNSKNLGTKVYNTYFNFFDNENEHLKNLFIDLKIHDFISVKCDFFKIHKDLSLKQSIHYNNLILLLFYNLKKTEYFKYLKLLNDLTYLKYENPFLRIDDLNITLDKLISIFDLKHIEDFSKINQFRILEIGAGSGRLSECLILTRDIKNYVICDIPPAIYLSYKRLKSAFPKKKIKLLVDINDNKKLTQEIIENDIVFIFPHQISYIEEKIFDLSIAVNCFHEMNNSTLKYYFTHLSKISRKLYFSIWEETKNWYSGSLFKKTERLNFDAKDYPIPEKWNLEHKKNLIFPANYLGIGYNLKN